MGSYYRLVDRLIDNKSIQLCIFMRSDTYRNLLVSNSNIEDTEILREFLNYPKSRLNGGRPKYMVLK